jgi:hypothetical protein
MSTANYVPETWNLTGSDAKETLAGVGSRRLLRDAFQRAGVPAPRRPAQTPGVTPEPTRSEAPAPPAPARVAS